MQIGVTTTPKIYEMLPVGRAWQQLFVKVKCMIKLSSQVKKQTNNTLSDPWKLHWPSPGITTLPSLRYKWNTWIHFVHVEKSDVHGVNTTDKWSHKLRLFLCRKFHRIIEPFIWSIKSGLAAAWNILMVSGINIIFPRKQNAAGCDIVFYDVIFIG